MFAYIQGVLEDIEHQRVTLDVQGVGYSILVPNSMIAKLPPLGGKVRLYTYFHVREDAQELYGFCDKEDKLFFEKLLSVSGIGPKGALGMLSAFTSSQLALAIITGDAKTLSSAPGVGKKTAERMILELKDKVDHEAIHTQLPAQTLTQTSERSEALEALMALGYPSADAERALAGIDEQDTALLIRSALKTLGNQRR